MGSLILNTFDWVHILPTHFRNSFAGKLWNWFIVLSTPVKLRAPSMDHGGQVIEFVCITVDQDALVSNFKTVTKRTLPCFGTPYVSYSKGYTQ